MKKIEKLHPVSWVTELEDYLAELKMLKRQLDSVKQISEKRAGGKEKSEEQNVQLRLRISGGKNTKYYAVNKSGKKNGTYIPKTDMKTIRKMAQDSYDKKVYEQLENEIKLVERFLTIYKKNNTEVVFKKMNVERQKLVTPLTLPDHTFIEKWQAEPYTKKTFFPGTPEHYTARGERVRSKSEVIIADTLMQFGVPYKYEMPLQLGDTVVHPDFCCLNVKTRQETFWEHLGMMDDAEYVGNNCQKLHKYQECGYFLGREIVISWETSDSPLNKDDVEKMIKKYFM